MPVALLPDPEGKEVRLIAIENAIFESWSPEEQQLFMKLNRDFAAKFTEKTKAL